MSKLRAAFERAKGEGRPALVAFLTAGYPTIEESPGLFHAMVEGGVDAIEIGVPFSDPVGEGPVIQHSSTIALANGVTPGYVFDLVARLRREGVGVPLVLMGYYNPVFVMGEEEYCRRAAAAGADGLIVVDLPAEEAGGVVDACRKHGLDYVPLVAPTSDEDRIAATVALATGFIYCVSVAGVTGARGELPAYLAEFAARIRAHSDLPVAIGFGISSREHVEQVGKLADGAAIGSRIVTVVGDAPAGERRSKLKEFIEDVTGRSGVTV